MKPTLFTCGLLLLSGTVPGLWSQEAPPSAAKPAASPDPRALAIISRASDYLAGTKQFSTSIDLSQDLVNDKGSKVQFTKQVDVKLRRPNRLQVDISTTIPKRSFWYDGKSVTLLDHRENFYGTSPAPDQIDAMIDQLEESLGVVFPLDDLLLTKPLVTPAAAAKSASYLGKERILGKTCHHVAFQHDAIDWQAWVEDGPKPLLRKVIINFKLDDGSPQITALLTNWDLGTKLPDFVFAFDPPVGAKKINFLPPDKSKAAAIPGEAADKETPSK
ncbi:DUF2092 domain-containing protein [Verrucomicrobium sp. BvORR034]|uniref:DUF2092 domain-containing protein n=1 Tax=Verrucomicrobium sp. BvORR034 TaxID=1396418 RepID=UPI000679E285|nr:DUF2092 domain-containing protein [Verrucomicrobium sp. BvORR034]